MSFMDLAADVEDCAKDLTSWQRVRQEIINRHAKASAVDEYITLLSLHKMLMDTVEQQLSDDEGIEKVQEVRNQDYNKFITRECTIGGSICIDTLYELTQRELEAGRMGPTHSLINLAVDAIAEPHYSREQLLRQEEKIKKLESRPALREKISRIFGK
ncbi:MAG: hypothetical protein AB8B92_11730 [Gammaproteobacteria bacterium]